MLLEKQQNDTTKFLETWAKKWESDRKPFNAAYFTDSGKFRDMVSF